MNKNTVVVEAEAFVQGSLEKESTGHDWWHIVRVRNNAKHIFATEGGDWLVIELAALLHDVGDRKVIGKDEDDYTIAESFLTSHNVDTDIVDQVLFIIKNMSYSHSISNIVTDTPIEFHIVQDADRLDAIGAIGIARAFAFGGNRHRQLYDPTANAKEYASTKEYRQSESSTFHHFEEKLLHIKDLLNTDAAKSIAKERDQYMRGFMTQFLDEWNGLK